MFMNEMCDRFKQIELIIFESERTIEYHRPFCKESGNKFENLLFFVKYRKILLHLK